MLGLATAFGVSAAGFQAFAPFLVLWGHRDAGLGGSAAGLLFVAQAAGEITGGLGGGVLADRLGGRQVLIVSTIGMAVAYGALFAVGAPWLAILVIYIAGLFEAAFHPTALALIADLTAPEATKHAFSVARAAANLGAIVGPLAGAALVTAAPIADAFLLSGALLAGSGLIVLVTLPRRGPKVSLAEEAEEIHAAVPGVRAIFRDPRLGLIVAGGALLTITLTWWETDGLVILRTQRPFGAGTFSLMLALTAAVTVVLQVPITRATEGRADRHLLLAGAATQAVGLAVLGLASLSVAAIAAAAVLLALGDMLYGPSLTTLVSRIAPPGRGATYQAAISTTQDIGQAAGPASGLALGGSLGGRVLWLLALPAGLIAGMAVGRVAARRTDLGEGGPAGMPPEDGTGDPVADPEPPVPSPPLPRPTPGGERP